MKKTSIMRKITLRIVLIGLVAFVLSLVFSYLLIVPNLREEAIGTAELANAEIIQRLDSLYSYVEDYTENLSLSVEQNQTIQAYFSNPTLQNQNGAALNLNNLVSHTGVVRCVMIESESGTRVGSINRVTEADYALLKGEWYRAVQSANYARSISPVYQIEWNNRYFSTTAYAKNFYFANERYTYTVFFNLDNVLTDSAAVASNTLDDYMLLDSTGSIFFSSGDSSWESAMAPHVQSQWSFLQRYKPANGGLCFKHSSIHTKWEVVSYVSERTVFRSFQGSVLSIFMVMLIFLLLTCVFLPRSLLKIVRPISNLSAVMASAAQQNWEVQVDIPSNDEVGELSRAFNQMLCDLKKNVEIIAEKEKQEQRIKFSLLISQINPHFIYNTLNSINYLVRRKSYEDIIVVNSALIYILQDRLRVSDIDIMDSIEKEQNVVNQYMSIQRYVYQGEVTLTWNIQEDLLLAQIPKNLIQPLVENAIFHGLIDENTGEMQGHVDITIHSIGNELEIIVRDDGCGISADMLARLQAPISTFEPYERGKNIGIPNVRSRLFYLYGSADCMRIESVPGEGTCIYLRFASGENPSAALFSGQ